MDIECLPKHPMTAKEVEALAERLDARASSIFNQVEGAANDMRQASRLLRALVRNNKVGELT